MKYQGGKARIARRLVDEMVALAPDKTRWVEPFVGGAWVLERAHAADRFSSLHAGDALEDVILLYRAVADGWVPPSATTREMHAALRSAPASPLRALVGFGSSYGGTFFAGFCGDALNGTRTNAAIAAANVAKRREIFQRTDLRHRDFREWEDTIGADTLVYCDPPYDGTYAYRGTDAFDSAAFWAWCARMAARGAAVFVSEYAAPAWAEQVWARTAKQTAARHENREATERLFRVPGAAAL